MKKEVKLYLKESGNLDLFNEDRFSLVKEYMKKCSKENQPLKGYLSIDSLNKAKFTADHIVNFYGHLSTT